MKYLGVCYLGEKSQVTPPHATLVRPNGEFVAPSLTLKQTNKIRSITKNLSNMILN